MTSLPINTLLAIVGTAISLLLVGVGEPFQASFCAVIAIYLLYSDLFPPTRNG